MNHIDSEEIIKQYPALFDCSIGALKDYKVKLHIDTSVQPVPPPNPVQCAKKVEDKLVELENADIIEKVDGPTPWVSPIVTPPKPDEIRLCVDMRGPNTVIKRERHITPTIEDGISDLNGACVFSKLYLNQGYHQIMLDESSRYITSFSTHVGLRRYKRLNFGICCASEIFQNVVRESLDGLPGVMNVSDDILIYGCNHTEHDKRLHAALKRLQEKGLTLNRQTCIFGQPTLKYLGYVFSSKEISPDPSKVAAIHETTTPGNASEVRSLLGLANYCQRFIPEFATITEPLRNLTKKTTKWVWEITHQRAFDKLKAALIAHTVMSHFDPKHDTEEFVHNSFKWPRAMLQ